VLLVPEPGVDAPVAGDHHGVDGVAGLRLLRHGDLENPGGGLRGGLFRNFGELMFKL